MFQLKEQDGAGDLKNILTSDMEIQSEVCPAGLQSCFGPVSPFYALFPMFWDGHVSPVPLICWECAICYFIVTLDCDYREETPDFETSLRLLHTMGILKLG